MHFNVSARVWIFSTSGEVEGAWRFRENIGVIVSDPYLVDPFADRVWGAKVEGGVIKRGQRSERDRCLIDRYVSIRLDNEGVPQNIA
jgi:hypothetical protein